MPRRVAKANRDPMIFKHSKVEVVASGLFARDHPARDADARLVKGFGWEKRFLHDSSGIKGSLRSSELV